MASTFLGLTIGGSGLHAYMAALNTTSNNIANSKTNGYTRQEVTRVESESLRTFNKTGTVGTGVTATSISQIRDTYYDYKYWENNQRYGEFYIKQYYMNEIEGYFEEENQNGMTKVLTKLSTTLKSLADDPSNTAVRNEAVNAFQNVATTANTLYNELQEIQKSINEEVKSTVDEINSIAEQLAVVNKQIATIEVSGESANELRDQRNLLIDQLSQLADVDVSEVEVSSSIKDSYGNTVVTGQTSYTVKLDGAVLVKDNQYYNLEVVPRTKRQNLSDAEGLYDIVWSNGQDFNMGSTSLGGTLQGLIEIRDGNNKENLQGKVGAVDRGENSVILTGTNITDVSLMNMPESGTITLANRDFTYSSFEYLGDGEYKFYMANELSDRDVEVITATSINGVAKDGYVGETVDYRGVPYYLNKLNEFARCYAKAMNDIHTTGQTLDGAMAGNLFTGNRPTGGEYNFGDTDVSSTSDTYYQLTAGNLTVLESLLEDSRLFSTTANSNQGVDGTDILEKIMALGEDGCINNSTPSSFFESLTSDISVAAKTAKTKMENRSNLSASIVNQRLSVSGVDEDEESMDLMRFQQAYNLCSKVISVMNECYDRLITQTGV